MSTVTYSHIQLNHEGAPFIVNTQTKVIEIALDRLAHHWDADEIQRQHPHLSLGQIHAALAYYYDHQSEMDQVIHEQLRQSESTRAALGESAIRAKLRAKGLIP